ncbi:hypothetical protein [Acetobacter persici]|uniref:hypothetical protein n=1 Tax=Acetobacter persici TaxID=1076596 RepID=UPI001BA67111|nr:hypothetical protein [Acetobacter persici]MBS0964361.1 hypothetical protein [Acetobacter persici]
MKSFAVACMASFFLAGVAQAEPMQMAPGQSMKESTQPAPGQTAQQAMEAMSMEQQMAVCSQIETLQKQGKALTATQQVQKAVCDKMNAGMDMPAHGAPQATLER